MHPLPRWRRRLRMTEKHHAMVRSHDTALGVWDEAQISVLRETYAKGLTEAEFGLYAQVCRRTGLDPFRRQIYAIKRREWDALANGHVEKVTFQVGIDG